MSNSEYSRKYNKYQTKFMLSDDIEKKNLYQQKMNYYSTMSGGNITDDYLNEINKAYQTNNIDKDISANKAVLMKDIENKYGDIMSNNKKFIENSFDRSKMYAMKSLQLPKEALDKFFSDINKMIIDSAKTFDLYALDTANTLRNIVATINDGMKNGDKNKVFDELLIISKLKYDSDSANIMNDYLTVNKDDITGFLGTEEGTERFNRALNATKENITEKKEIDQEIDQTDALKTEKIKPEEDKSK